MGSKTTVVRRIIAVVAVVACGGSLMGLLPSCETTLTTFNPCGSIFAFCQPYQVDALFADVPQYDLDPTCSIPFYGIEHPDTAGGCSDTETYLNTQGDRPN
jgi:hypothetical protein